MAHKAQAQLTQELDDAAAVISVGARYAHYKHPDKLYTVIGLAVLEASDEPCVIYKAQYGDNIVFVRPATSWLQEVMSHGQQVKRFTKVS